MKPQSRKRDHISFFIFEDKLELHILDPNGNKRSKESKDPLTIDEEIDILKTTMNLPNAEKRELIKQALDQKLKEKDPIQTSDENKSEYIKDPSTFLEDLGTILEGPGTDLEDLSIFSVDDTCNDEAFINTYESEQDMISLFMRETISCSGS